MIDTPYLASTSVDTLPGTTFRISQPNITNNLSIASSNTLVGSLMICHKLFISFTEIMYSIA